MAITYVSTGGLFTRLGAIAGQINDKNAEQGGAATTNVLAAGRLTTRYTALQTSFANSPAFTSILDGLFAQVQGMQAQLGAYNTNLNQTIAQQILMQQVNANSTLSTLDVPHALASLVANMTNDAYYVTTSSVAAGSQTDALGVTPIGNPVIVSSVIQGNGLTLEYAFPETIAFATTADKNGTATANNEPMSIIGQATISDGLNWLWPSGSGIQSTLNVTDPTANNSAGNVLTNSSFDTFTTANQPDNWNVLVGVAGTDILSGGGTANTYTGLGNSLKILGDGSTLSSIAQVFNTASIATVGAGGTPATLTERTPYAVSFWYKLTNASPAAGVMAVDLVDGSNANIADDQSIANTVSVTLTAVSDTNWHNATAVFRTPTNLPSTVKLRVRLTTALTTAKGVYIDQLAMNAMTQFYAPNGPFFSAFAGSTPTLVGDAWTVAITTNMADTTWQGAFQRLFNIGGLGYRLPTAGSTSISAGLIA